MRSGDMASWLNGSAQEWLESPAFDSLLAKTLAVVLAVVAVVLICAYLDSGVKNHWLAGGAGLVAALVVIIWLSGAPAGAEARHQAAERVQENVQTVRTWIAEYGATIVDEEASRLASDIAAGRSGGTYLLQRPAGVIEVSLREAADGEYYLMHGASQLDHAQLHPDT